MNKLILLTGVMCLVVGLVPLPIDQTKQVELRIHQVHHEHCDGAGCVVVDKEM